MPEAGVGIAPRLCLNLICGDVQAVLLDGPVRADRTISAGSFVVGGVDVARNRNIARASGKVCVRFAVSAPEITSLKFPFVSANCGADTPSDPIELAPAAIGREQALRCRSWSLVCVCCPGNACAGTVRRNHPLPRRTSPLNRCVVTCPSMGTQLR